MDLNEIKKQIEAEANKTVTLQNEKRALENNIKKTVYQNIKTIVTPAIKEMNDFLKLIRDKTNVYFKFDDKYFPLALGLDAPDYYSFKLRINSYGVYLDFEKNTSYEFHRDISDPDGEYAERDVFSNGYHLYLSEWFYSEERAMELVDICREKYAVILDYYASKLRDENDNLSTAIELLKDTYAKSHCIEHNEDGTVEIHLGGKTYTATLKEE